MSPRSAKANEEMRARSRERILLAALEVFAEKGYHAATISEITARAGVSRGLLTYYFPGKQDLVDELLDRYLDEVSGILAVTGTPDERLAAIIDGVLTAAALTVPVQRMTLSLVVSPATHPRFAAAESRQEERVAALEDGLRELFAARGAADPAVEEVLLRSVLEGVIFKTAVYGEEYPVEPIRRRLYALYGLPAPAADLPGLPTRRVDRMRAGRTADGG
ncbi:TetR/AcrR family transcriptional regulator [Actinacidiphila guanduensis]|jgi:AcrR family transcriptional regulator|uniref:Transcriptional regulator, TetR family n=1 Tax=Actinacidiphila guanduensis TaxID=310781 RepID=A0A1G9ZJK4_9ACTN|nr:TetR/AcrR family transcriptional regulator [Actinacidiphila guanduensis]SDN21474.1 transcriptional regulator, TetR family [Actinacidiphila guanduensis]